MRRPQRPLKRRPAADRAAAPVQGIGAGAAAVSCSCSSPSWCPSPACSRRAVDDSRGAVRPCRETAQSCGPGTARTCRTKRLTRRWRRDIPAARAPAPRHRGQAAELRSLNGSRTILASTARNLKASRPSPARAQETLGKINPAWGERATWAAIKGAARPVHRLLPAGGARPDAERGRRDRRGAPDQAIYRDVFARTFWISGGRHVSA